MICKDQRLLLHTAGVLGHCKPPSGSRGAKSLESLETLHFIMPENRQDCMLIANVLLHTANKVTGKIFELFRFINRKNQFNR